MNSEKRVSLFTFHFSLRWRELVARTQYQSLLKLSTFFCWKNKSIVYKWLAIFYFFLLQNLSEYAIFAHIFSLMTQTDINQIETLVHEGNKLAAIKLLMDTAHIGLKEAKDIIDNFFLGKQTDLQAAVAQVQTRYSENYESISANSDANGKVHFFYQKGNHKEEVTPGHPVWERVRNHYLSIWEDAPEGFNEAREPFRKAVLEMEAKAGYTPKKSTQTTKKEQTPYRKEQTTSDKENTLFIKKGSSDFFKWFFYLFIAAIIAYIIYLAVSH